MSKAVEFCRKYVFALACCAAVLVLNAVGNPVFAEGGEVEQQ